MRSVGEAMAIGRTFKEALQKALRSLEIGAHGLDDLAKMPEPEELKRLLATPGPQRVFRIKQAIKAGFSLDGIHELTMIDPWFLDNIHQIVEFEEGLKGRHAAAGGGAAGLSREDTLPGQAVGFQRRATGPALRVRRTDRPRAPRGPRHPPRLQVRGHVRRRVRGLHPLLLLHL